MLPNPSHWAWGGATSGLLDRWTGHAAYPEAVGSLSLVCLAVIAGVWWRAGWQVSRIRVGVTIFFALLDARPVLCR